MKKIIFPISMSLMFLMCPALQICAETSSVEACNENSKDALRVALMKTQSYAAKGGFRKARAAVVYSSIEAYISNGILYMSNDENMENVNVTIENEVGNIVLNTSVDINIDTPTEINIGYFMEGTYIMYVTIDGEQYQGTFEL